MATKDKPEENVSVPAATLADLIAAAVDRRVAEIMGGKGADQKIAEAMAQQRGTNLPPLQEALVECRSPITQATFTARLIMARAPGSPMRVVELLDYERPDGWDRSVADKGRVPNGVEIYKMDALGNVTETFTERFALSVHRDYMLRDNWAIVGKPLPDVWRTSYAPAPGSVTLSPEQLAKLGITSATIAEALAEKAAE